jgi:glycosyltransferase involved in cell wall biosynthesis
MENNVMKAKIDLMIINRGFNSQNGELISYAEMTSKNNNVSVLAQSNIDLEKKFKNELRKTKVKINTCRSYSNSASTILSRIADAIFFMVWVVIKLIQIKPLKIYIATDPPIIVPFIVAIYSRLTGTQFFYHVQDIHPEIYNLLYPLNPVIRKILQKIDNFTLKNAKSIITLTEEMKKYIEKRSNTKKSIYLIPNPGIATKFVKNREHDIIFCGNAGRLNHISIILEAIDKYLEHGGHMNFTFAGGGIYAPAILEASKNRNEIKYKGKIGAEEATKLVAQHKWALLPIIDEATKYAFPSKSSTYVQCRTPILAICGKDNIVARWIEENNVGIVCEPNLDKLVDCLFDMEKLSFNMNFDQKIIDELGYSRFCTMLNDVIFFE